MTQAVANVVQEHAHTASSHAYYTFSASRLSGAGPGIGRVAVGAPVSATWSPESRTNALSALFICVTGHLETAAGAAGSSAGSASSSAKAAFGAEASCCRDGPMLDSCGCPCRGMRGFEPEEAPARTHRDGPRLQRPDNSILTYLRRINNTRRGIVTIKMDGRPV